uniref:Putative LOV domain-containing protein n=1 Tax=Ishige okamurae TaxID=233772 RepID=A0A126WUU6_9PHAE|nr:putative LOV domain-containing protein [Ishige okamurae]
MSAEVKAPVFTSIVHNKLQHHSGWPETDVDFSDIGLDLAELQNLSGFLMNETPDSTGHFYPPWANDADPLVKAEPVASGQTPDTGPQVLSSVATPAIPQTNVPGVVPADIPISFGAITVPTSSSTANVVGGSTIRKNSAGGVTRRRASSKEEQAKKRRERNRVLARRTRLRKKFFFQSLQQQVAGLQRENERLKSIVTAHCPGTSGEILLSCVSGSSSMVADCANQATALLDQSGFLLVKALQSSQPSFCVTDPQLPDNPIVYASDNFIELTGYARTQVLGRNCRFLQGPDTDPDAVAKIRKGIEEGIDTSVYLRQYKADGTVFWNHVFVAALRNSDRKIINYVGIQHPLDKEPSPEVVACINGEGKQRNNEVEPRANEWAGWQEPMDITPWRPFNDDDSVGNEASHLHLDTGS